MFDVSLSELLLIALVALVVLGPQRLPEVARGAGRMLGRLRVFVANVKYDLDHELRSHELTELRRLKEELEQTKQTFEESSHRLLDSISQADVPAQPAAESLPAPGPAPVTGPSPAPGTPPPAPASSAAPGLQPTATGTPAPARRTKSRHGQAKKKRRKSRR